MKTNNELSPSPENTYRESAATCEGSLSGVDSGSRVSGLSALLWQSPTSERSGVHALLSDTPPAEIADPISNDREKDAEIAGNWNIPVIGVDLSARVVMIAMQRKRALDEQRRALERARRRLEFLSEEFQRKAADLETDYERRRGKLNAEYRERRANVIQEIDALTQCVAAEGPSRDDP